MSDLPPASGSETPPPQPTSDPVSNPATDLPSGWPANLSPAMPTLPPLPSLDSVPQSFQAAQTPPVADPIVPPVFTPAPPVTLNPTSVKPPLSTSKDETARDTEKASISEEDDSDEIVNRPFDPALVWIVVVAATIIGLGGLAPDVRYTTLWTILIVVAVLAILFDRLEVEIPTASDMAWGVGYGLLLGVPVVVIALPQLQRALEIRTDSSEARFQIANVLKALDLRDESNKEMGEFRQRKQHSVDENIAAAAGNDANNLLSRGDPKSAALVENFGGQWLQLRNLNSVKPDPDRFPVFTNQLRADMHRETQLFFNAIIHEDCSILDFLDG